MVDIKIPKKRINSKAKGNSFERSISNLLSKRFAAKTGIEQSFRRNIDSGSFFGNTNQKRLQTHNLESANFGDIICPSDFKYSIECKNYKGSGPSLKNLMEQDYKEWDTWLSQALQDSKNANKEMAIIIKYNRVEEIVLIRSELPNIYNIKYKEYFVVTLKDFLSFTDDTYFI